MQQQGLVRGPEQPQAQQEQQALRRALAPQRVREEQPVPERRLAQVVRAVPQEQRHAVLLVWIVQQVHCCLRAAIHAAFR